MKLGLALILLSAAPAMAQQVCATRDDLAAGIVVTYANGGVDTFTADPLAPGVVRWQGEYQGMNLGTTVLAQGYIYLSALGPNGQEVTYDYGLLPADLPLPTPGGSWEGVATVTFAGQSSTERQIHAFGVEGSLTMGTCMWRLIPVTITWPESVEELYWFPELGISVRAGDVMTAITPLALMP